MPTTPHRLRHMTCIPGGTFAMSSARYPEADPALLVPVVRGNAPAGR
jgi:hypothetical protein